MPGDGKIRLEIVTPYELLFDGSVDMVIITASDGELGILPGHTAMFAALKDGEIRLRTGDDWQVLASSIGYAEIAPSEVIIVINAAEWADKIDVARARRSQERATSRLSDPQISDLERRRTRQALERANNRLRVAERYKDQGRKQNPPA
jgi:F-type H+-transporting ATPase subunit epsilon